MKKRDPRSRTILFLGEQDPKGRRNQIKSLPVGDSKNKTTSQNMTNKIIMKLKKMRYFFYFFENVYNIIHKIFIQICLCIIYYIQCKFVVVYFFLFFTECCIQIESV